MLVNLFDSSGTLIGVTDKAGLADEKGKFPRMKQALYVDSISSVTGSFIGTSSVTAYLILFRRIGWRSYRSDGSGCWSAVPAGYLSVAAGGNGARLRCSWRVDLRWRVDDLKSCSRELAGSY